MCYPRKVLIEFETRFWVWIRFQPWHAWHWRLQDQFIYRTIRSDGTLTSSWFEDTAISQSLSFANHHIPIQEWATRLPQTGTRSNPSRFYPILLLVTNIFWPPYHFNDVYYRNRTILLIFRERLIQQILRSFSWDRRMRSRLRVLSFPKTVLYPSLW